MKTKKKKQYIEASKGQLVTNTTTTNTADFGMPACESGRSMPSGIAAFDLNHMGVNGPKNVSPPLSSFMECPEIFNNLIIEYIIYNLAFYITAI